MQQTSFEFLDNEATNELLSSLDPEQQQRLIELMAQAIVAALRLTQGAHDEQP